MSNYKNSTRRLILLLALLAAILYNMYSGDKQVKIAGLFVFSIWILAFESWRNK